MSWPCKSDWRCSANDHGQRAHSGPNLAALRRYAHHSVQVANCSTRQFNEFERSERKLGEILDLWEKEGGRSGQLYVKDWHQVLLLEQDGGSQDQIYTTPDIFKGVLPYNALVKEIGTLLVSEHVVDTILLSDDWMTHHALSRSPRDDYRFTYAGPGGTFTPLHRDVYGSYSWSSNIVGRKCWWLIPPEHTELFRVRNSGEDVIFDIREVDKALWKDKVFVVEQQAGETIFVPSGWYHQVENLDFVSCFNAAAL